jgi:hypothetical protein
MLIRFFGRSEEEIRKMVEPTKEEVNFIVDYIKKYNELNFPDFINYIKKYDFKEYYLFYYKIKYYKDPLLIKENKRNEVDNLIISVYPYFKEFKNNFENIWMKYIKYSSNNKDDEFCKMVLNIALGKGFSE